MEPLRQQPRRRAQAAVAAKPTAVDLFCGSGAVTAALRRGGFKVLASVDNDPVACRTYRLNHPGVDLIERDILSVVPHEIVRNHPDAAEIGVMVICAPCQPFSQQNRKRGDDGRAQLIVVAAGLAHTLRPRCILIENVPGLVTPTNAHVIRELKSVLAGAGYILSAPRKVDAADFGVPQRRLRCVMVASQHERAVKLFEGYDFGQVRRTVREAIGELPPLVSGQGHPTDPLHRARSHQAIALQRLKAIPIDGGSRSDLPKSLRLKCHAGDDHSFSDVYGRMRWDDVAPTLTTGCDDVTRGRFAHPEQDRAITLREASLLQTFPRNYKFAGNRREIARQIGNAVPVLMVEGLVPMLKKIIRFSTQAGAGSALTLQR